MRGLVATVAVSALMGFGLLATSAYSGSLPAGKTLDFGTTATGGTLNYTLGKGSQLTITNAPITFVQQSPSDRRFAITGGTIDVVTGGCIKGCTYNTRSQTHGSEFADGGVVKVYGSLPEFANDPTGLLFEGTFNSTLGSKLFSHAVCPVTNVTLSNKAGKSGGLDGCVQITDVNQALLADMNFPPDSNGQGYFSTLAFALAFDGTGWNGMIKSSDLNIIPAPEPSTLLLFGSGLLIGAGLLRRKFRSQ
jgi:PEP-CTERM motif